MGSFTQWSEVLFSNKIKFFISFGNSDPRVRKRVSQNLNSLKLSMKFLQPVMIWLDMSSAGFWSTVFQVQSYYKHLPEDFKVLSASICWQSFMEMQIVFSSMTCYLPIVSKLLVTVLQAIVLPCLIS